MKKLLIALLFIKLFLISNIYSQTMTINGITYDTTHVYESDLPISVSGDHILLVLQENCPNQKISTTGNIYFNDCDSCGLISEPGNKYTITYLDTTFGGSNYQSQFGVRVTGADDFLLRNIRLVAGWNLTDSFQMYPKLVAFPSTAGGTRECNDILIDSCYFYMTGFAYAGFYGMSCIDMPNPIRCDIENDTIILEGYGFNSRQQYPLLAVGCNILTEFGDSLTTGSRSDYSIRTSKNYVETSWIGFYVTAANGSEGGVWVADSNEIVLKWVQESTVPGAGGSMVGDGGAFASYGGLDKIFMRDNIVTHVIDSTSYSYKVRGGNGMYFGPILNTLAATPRSEFAYNNFDCGMFINGIDHGYCVFNKWDGFHDVDFHHNTLKTTIYDVNENYNFGTVIWMWNLDGCNFYDNSFTMLNLQDSTPGVGIYLRNIAGSEQPTFNRDTIWSTDYHICVNPQNDSMSNVDFIDMYWGRVSGQSSLSDEGAVVALRSSEVGTSTIYDVTDVNFYNLRTDGNVSDTSMEWIPYSTSLTDADWLSWYKTFEIIAVDSVGADLNAQVVLISGYGDTIYNTSIGTDGIDSSDIKYWRPTGGASDSSYNTFSGFAVYGSDTVFNNSFSVGENDSTITFTFGTLAAEPPTVKKAKGAYLKNNRK